MKIKREALKNVIGKTKKKILFLILTIYNSCIYGLMYIFIFSISLSSPENTYSTHTSFAVKK